MTCRPKGSLGCLYRETINLKVALLKWNDFIKQVLFHKDKTDAQVLTTRQNSCHHVFSKYKSKKLPILFAEKFPLFPSALESARSGSGPLPDKKLATPIF